MNKKFFISTLLVFTLQSSFFAQTTDAESSLKTTIAKTTEGWEYGGSVGLNFSNANFSNWAAGGQNSTAFSSLVSLFAKYSKNGHSWVNTLDFGYGLMQQGSGKFIKTDDKIDFSSLYGKQVSKAWYTAAFANFKTQSSDGFNYPNDSIKISKFLAPAYILIAVGMDYKPNDFFNAFISPLTYRGTIVADQTLANQGAFGVTKATYDNNGTLTTNGENMLTQVGGYVRLIFRKNFLENDALTVLSKADVFSNYLKNPQNLIINWETIFNFKITKYISTSVVLHLIYDDNIKAKNTDGTIGGPKVQFKNVLSIGFTYKF